MKTYRVSILDFNRKHPAVISQKYIKGLSAARASIPIKAHWCGNGANGFVGYDKKYEYWIMET